VKFVQKHSDIIVLGTLWIISILVLRSKFNLNYIVPIKSYIGMSMLCALSVWRIIRRKHFKIVLAVFLFLGCIGLIQFSVSTNYMYLGDSDNPTSKLYFSPISVILLVLLLALNVGSLSKIYKDQEEIVPERSNQSQAYLNKYYDELKNKETAYIQQILSTRERWQKEYIEAAEKLVEERK
jgi:hypothetical protein